MGLPAWVMANALVGALVVWLDLSPISVMGHFLLSLGALWNAVVLCHKAREEPAPSGSGDPQRRELAEPLVRRMCNALLVAAAVALVTGTVVTGSGPHAGDRSADRLPFAVGEVARIHGIAVFVFGGLTLAVWWLAQSGHAAPSVEARVRRLFLVIGFQAAVGYIQYFTGVPAWLVGIHVFGAALVWTAVLWLRLGLSEPAAMASTLDTDAGAAAADAAAGTDTTSEPVAAEVPGVVIGR